MGLTIPPGSKPVTANRTAADRQTDDARATEAKNEKASGWGPPAAREARTARGPGRSLTLPDVAPDAKLVVKKGDTLSKIAQRSGVPLAKLLAFNPHLATPERKNGDLIFPGDEVQIAPSRTQPAPAPVNNGGAAAPTGPVSPTGSTSPTSATQATTPAAATEAPTMPLEQATEQAKRLVAGSDAASSSQLGAQAASSRQRTNQLTDLVSQANGDPATLADQILSDDLADQALEYASKAASQAREGGTLQALRDEVNSRLARPEVKAAVEQLKKFSELSPEQQQAAQAKFTPEEVKALNVADRTAALSQAVELQAKLEAAKNDPAKLVDIVTAAKNDAEFASAVDEVAKTAQKAGKLNDVLAAVRQRAEPALAKVQGYRNQLATIQQTQGDEAAQKAAENPPEDVLAALGLQQSLTRLDDAVSGLKALDDAKADVVTQAGTVVTLPPETQDLAANVMLERARAKGPEAVLEMYDSLDQVTQLDSPLKQLRALPEAQQGEFFSKLSAGDQQKAIAFRKLEMLRDSLRVDAAVARAKSDPTKLLTAIEQAPTPEEADAITRLAVQGDKAGPVRDGVMKVTAERLKTLAPLAARRIAAYQSGKGAEFDKALSPQDTANLAAYERVQQARISTGEAGAALLEKKLPPLSNNRILKPGESLAKVATAELEKQLGAGNTETFKNAMAEVSPKLAQLEAFAAAGLSGKDSEAVSGVPVKALLDGLTPPGGRAELIVPTKPFSVSGSLVDESLTHDVMVKVTDANNDVKYYALPTGARRDFSMPLPVARSLRGAYERANGIGDGKTGLLENFGIPGDATQAQLTKTFELLKKEDPEAYKKALEAYAYPSSFTTSPLGADDLGKLLEETKAKAPDDFAAMVKGLLPAEATKDPKKFGDVLKRMSKGTDDEKRAFKDLQERVGSMAGTLPVASASYQHASDGSMQVKLSTSLMGVKEKSTFLADVNLGRMDGFAKQNGVAFAQGIFAQQMAAATGPTTYETPTSLANSVAATLDLGLNDKATEYINSEAGQQALAEGKDPGFAMYRDADAASVRAVTAQIQAITDARGAGAKPEVEVMQLINLMRDGQAAPLKLFKVTGKDGPMFVDGAGNAYRSFEHFKKTNQEMPGTILAPTGGKFDLDDKGQVKVESFDSGMTVKPWTMNWVNENLLTTRVMDAASWGLTVVGGVAMISGIGAPEGAGAIAAANAMRAAAGEAVTQGLLRSAAKKTAIAAFKYTSAAAHWGARPIVNLAARNAVTKFAFEKAGTVAMAGMLPMAGYGAYNTVTQFNYINDHSQTGALSTWAPVTDFESQEGFSKRQVVMGAAMTGLQAVGIGSAMKLGAVLQNPAKLAAAEASGAGRRLANVALYSNAANLPVTGLMTWDLYNFRRRYGALMTDEQRNSLDTNLTMNMVGAAQGLLSSVDVNALRLRGLNITEKHVADAERLANKPFDAVRRWTSRHQTVRSDAPKGSPVGVGAPLRPVSTSSNLETSTDEE